MFAPQSVDTEHVFRVGLASLGSHYVQGLMTEPSELSKSQTLRVTALVAVMKRGCRKQSVRNMQRFPSLFCPRTHLSPKRGNGFVDWEKSRPVRCLQT